jgi:ppGpp synthetase/RelA/SpoT-type nucleotidyltranferase
MEPAVLSETYETVKPSLEKVARYTETRIAAELGEGGSVAIVGRTKELSSVHLKLQAGRFAGFRELDDLVGLKVVVLRRRDVEPTAAAIRASFQVDYEKERTSEPSDFKYREPHLVVRPPQDYLDRNPDLEGIAVEVQITTALQHTLDQITHGFDYKPSTLDWAKRRLVAQLRASLELLDNMLDDMDHSAELIHEVAVEPQAFRRQQAVLAAMISKFDDASLPADRRRLAEIANALTEAAGVAPEDVAELLERHRDLVDATSLNPLDALLGALLREKQGDLLAAYNHRLLISDELESLCLEARAVAADKRVALL